MHDDIRTGQDPAAGGRPSAELCTYPERPPLFPALEALANFTHYANRFLRRVARMGRHARFRNSSLPPSTRQPIAKLTDLSPTFIQGAQALSTLDDSFLWQVAHRPWWAPLRHAAMQVLPLAIASATKRRHSLSSHEVGLRGIRASDHHQGLPHRGFDGHRLLEQGAPLLVVKPQQLRACVLEPPN